MRFRMLGPFEVADGERQVSVAAGKQSGLLADLLLHANRVVPVPRLVDDLWGEDVPDSAVKSVQIHVSKLRKALPEPRLQTRGSGYLLEVRAEELDLDVFSSVAAEGRSKLGEDDARALELLTEALALWRGPALAGLDAPFVPVEAARLEELQLACREDRMEALLGLGRHHELVPELEATTARYPLRERPRRLLMLGLYRAGRQAEALAAYSSFRELLDEELGIEPSPELRELERRILTQDAALEAPRGARSSLRRSRPGGRGGSGGDDRRGLGPHRLLERERALDDLGRALESARVGSGSVALVVGEAGVGKTALVESWQTGTKGAARLLVGACDPLMTPRALGPIRDVAQQAGGRLSEAIGREPTRDAVLEALLAELSDGPTILVFEDVHWADEATLDILALMGRRISRLPAVLVATTRPEGLSTGHRLLASLGELPPGLLVQVDLQPLSAGGVEELAREAGRPADGLHEATGGNPFFVTEVLAGAGGSGLPPTVRAAVLARCGRLSSAARPVIDVVSVVPGRTELALISRLLGPQTEAIEECLAAGILESDGSSLRFRHEIARLAVESELSAPRRAELERAVLEALEEVAGDDLARAVHHARLAGDDDSVGRLAPAAAREAASAGAHREAVEHYRAALSVADDLSAEARAELLESLSVEAYLADCVADALDARREALQLRRELGDPVRIGDDLRWLARLLWWSADGNAARETAAQAVDVLEAAGPTRELAMALSSLSQLEMLAWRPAEAIALAERARALAHSLGDEETAVHALTNIGVARRLEGDYVGGRKTLIEAFAAASAGGFPDHAGRALSGLASTAMELRDAELVDADLELAIGYLDNHNLDAYLRYVLGIRALWRVERGDPAGAESDAVESLRGGTGAGVSGHPGRVALARVQMRRGNPAAVETLEDALRLARSSRELQRLGPAVAALAEHAWLTDTLDDVVDQVDDVYRALLDVNAAWLAGELALWLWRAGRLERAPDIAPAPYRLLLEGRWREAATAWHELGLPYQQAEALSHGDTSEAIDEALALFERVGAPAAATRLRRAGRPVGGERVLATLVITDLVDSTAKLARVGDRVWADLVGRHDDAVREELRRYAGEEIDATGDGFLAFFAEPARAIRCGQAIVARVGALGLDVRVGVHTGEVERRDGRARGIAVNVTARVAGCAAAGEVLVSSTTRDLAAGSGISFVDRGKHELKGIDRPRRLFAVEGR